MSKKTAGILFISGLLVFLYLIYDYGLTNIIDNIQKTGFWLFPIIGIWAVVYLLNSLSLYLILGDERSRISYFRILTLTLSGFAINYVTPVLNVGGEPYRILVLKDVIGAKQAFSKIILYKMLQWLSHFMLWLFTIIIVLYAFPLDRNTRIILSAAFFVLLAVAIFMLSRSKKGFLKNLYDLISSVRILRPVTKRFEASEGSIKETDGYIKELYNERKYSFFSILFIEFTARIVASFEFYFILLSIGHYVTPFQAVYINAFTSLIINIFFFIPFAVGIKEGSLYLVVKTLMITAGTGIYVSLVSRLREFFWVLAGLLLIQFNRSIQSTELQANTELKKNL